MTNDSHWPARPPAGDPFDIRRQIGGGDFRHFPIVFRDMDAGGGFRVRERETVRRRSAGDILAGDGRGTRAEEGQEYQACR